MCFSGDAAVDWLERLVGVQEMKANEIRVEVGLNLIDSFLAGFAGSERQAISSQITI